MQNLNKTLLLLMKTILFCSIFSVHAEDIDSNDTLSLTQQLVEMKKEMLILGRDMKVLEGVLLYPEQQRISIYLSMDVGQLFSLETLVLRMDDQIIAKYEYTVREEYGLNRGAVQRVFIGNFLPGKHKLRAVFTGKGPHGRVYKRALSYTVDKGSSSTSVKLVIRDDLKTQQPVFLAELIVN